MEVSSVSWFFWRSKTEVKALYYCKLCCLNRGHVYGNIAAEITFLNVQTNITTTFTSICISKKNIWRRQLHIALSKRNVADDENYYTIYAHISFYGLQLRRSTETCRSQEEGDKDAFCPDRVWLCTRFEKGSIRITSVLSVIECMSLPTQTASSTGTRILVSVMVGMLVCEEMVQSVQIKIRKPMKPCVRALRKVSKRIVMRGWVMMRKKALLAPEAKTKMI